MVPESESETLVEIFQLRRHEEGDRPCSRERAMEAGSELQGVPECRLLRWRSQAVDWGVAEMTFFARSWKGNRATWKFVAFV